ncbi:NUDIX domain-containing protein [Cribrihabitans marinus]|uniref:NUDIX domain-containing protein n=1 Tax=Cribrihabitans marinus TaxID=1227549 RepID=A0A1H7D8R6_9RHOB|nr:NUDIX hydrolase [Cribrihabitans marinus]GGH37580.1 NUDIX hydrolase [Cribrihabitans marinus]SEJ95972.1 NUDIX domain-containing protein [Cribrihabitans marinus]
MPDHGAIAEQIAALPICWDKKGRLRVLMVTSRDTGRWVMPKGWRMDGKSPWRAAKIEALEEAGAVGSISDQAIGSYHYIKRLRHGEALPCRVVVYPMVVDRLKRRWKERGERKRRWFPPRRAARLVDERELSTLLAGLEDMVRGGTIIGARRKAS